MGHPVQALTGKGVKMSLIHRTFRHRFKLCTQARPDRRRRPLLLLRPVREETAVEERPETARADGARGDAASAQEGRRSAGHVRGVRGDLQEQGSVQESSLSF